MHFRAERSDQCGGKSKSEENINKYTHSPATSLGTHWTMIQDMRPGGAGETGAQRDLNSVCDHFLS